MKRAAASAVLAFACLWTPTAEAFYTRGYFDRAAELGGAGGLYYTGSTGERRWDCSACHENAPRTLRVAFAVAPEDFIASGQYRPGVEYTVTATFSNESLGFGSQYNSNGFVAEFTQDATAAGTLRESADTELLGNGRAVTSRNDSNNLASWTFRWTAPTSGGPVTISFAAVDGNGGGEPALSFQDPENDDVYIGELKLEQTQALAPLLPSLPRSSLPTWPWAFAALLLLGTLWVLARRLVRIVHIRLDLSG